MTPKAELGIDAGANKVHRALFFLIHSLLVTFVFVSFLADVSWSLSEDAFCWIARSLTSVFLKPMIISIFYCLNYLLDNDGWMLHRNPVTDSMVFIVGLYLAIYLAITVAFTLPLALSFPYLFLCPVFVLASFGGSFSLAFGHDRTVKLLMTKEYNEKVKNRYNMVQIGMKNPDGSWREGWSEEEHRKAMAAQMLLKRLTAYSVFLWSVFAIMLFPLYQGEAYGQIVEEAVENVVPSLRFWTPKFTVEMFAWPKDLPLPDQVAFAVSLSVLSLEYLPLVWGLAMERLFPRGHSSNIY